MSASLIMIYILMVNYTPNFCYIWYNNKVEINGVIYEIIKINISFFKMTFSKSPIFIIKKKNQYTLYSIYLGQLNHIALLHKDIGHVTLSYIV